MLEGMDWLLFAFAFEFGAIRGPDVQGLALRDEPVSYVQTEVEATAFRHLQIGGALRSYQPFEASTNWDPFRIDYSIHALVRFGGLSFGVEHLCYHPVNGTSGSGGYERAFVRIATP
jgi:hypothetical protein